MSITLFQSQTTLSSYVKLTYLKLLNTALSDARNYLPERNCSMVLQTRGSSHVEINVLNYRWIISKGYIRSFVHRCLQVLHLLEVVKLSENNFGTKSVRTEPQCPKMDVAKSFSKIQYQ